MKLLVDLAIVFIIVCASASLIAGSAHFLCRGLIAQLAPGARARLRLALLFAPLAAGVFAVSAALLPSLLHVAGIAEDHCLAPAAHGHAHLCFVHQAQGSSGALGWAVALLGAILLGRVGLVAARAARAHRAFGAVLASSRIRERAPGILEFDSELPVCLTFGIGRPHVYISSGAISALGPECVEAALAHEQGHLARHETRLRLAASLAGAFHLPLLAEAAQGGWLDDSELLCDRHAARATGSAGVVAEALVRFHRAHRRLPGPRLLAGACLCADGSRLNARVANLLSLDVRRMDDGAAGHAWPYGLGVGLLALGLALQAPRLHHALESLVGLLSHSAH